MTGPACCKKCTADLHLPEREANSYYGLEPDARVNALACELTLTLQSRGVLELFASADMLVWVADHAGDCEDFLLQREECRVRKLAKATAIAKLTDDERRLLGVD